MLMFRSPVNALRPSSRGGPAFRGILLFLIPLFFLCACENDIRTIKLLTSPDKLPVETEKDVELLYSDSAKLKLRLKAPEMNRYEGTPNYIELPKGVVLTFYDDSM